MKSVLAPNFSEVGGRWSAGLSRRRGDWIPVSWISKLLFGFGQLFIYHSTPVPSVRWMGCKHQINQPISLKLCECKRLLSSSVLEKTLDCQNWLYPQFCQINWITSFPLGESYNAWLGKVCVTTVTPLFVLFLGRGHDLLQRTNSSVSSNRVGIAAVHPYWLYLQSVLPRQNLIICPKLKLLSKHILNFQNL